SHAKRALTIAAAGAHSLLMIGPPGTGKSMLAQRLPGILPPLAEHEALAAASIASLAGRFSPAAWGVRPFRAPHHTASAVALVGGARECESSSHDVTSAQVRTRVIAGRERQVARQGKPNSRLGPREIETHCVPDAEGAALLARAMAQLSLSARAYHRILKVART